MQAVSTGVDGIQYRLEGYSTALSSMQIEASGNSRLRIPMMHRYGCEYGYDTGMGTGIQQFFEKLRVRYVRDMCINNLLSIYIIYC